MTVPNRTSCLDQFIVKKKGAPTLNISIEKRQFWVNSTRDEEQCGRNCVFFIGEDAAPRTLIKFVARKRTMKGGQLNSITKRGERRRTGLKTTKANLWKQTIWKLKNRKNLIMAYCFDIHCSCWVKKCKYNLSH